MPLVLETEASAEDKHPKGRVLPKFSIFSFVINTNIAPKNIDEKLLLERKFGRWLKRVFNDRNVYMNVLVDQNNRERNIEQIDTFIGNEIGKIKHRLHANVIIRVRHHNRFTIDVDYLYDVWRQESGFENNCNIENPKSAYDRAAYLLWYGHLKNQTIPLKP